MDRLWAPWRIRYIKKEKKRRTCFLCEANKNPKKHYVIYKTRHSIALLNLYPYNNGHILIAPQKHKKDIEKLSEEEMLDLILTLKYCKKLLDITLKPEGYNIGMNLSEIAGAGVKNHIHLHLVPRWKADTNFMPIISDTKIISQSLEDLYKELKNAQSKIY